MNRHPESGFYTDPTPYRRRSSVRPWSRRWSVEFWTEDGDHDFRRFFTRRAAVRWAVEHMGEQWKATVVSAGDAAPMPPRWDMFVVVDPAIDDAPLMVAEVEAERGTVRFVQPPDLGRTQAQAERIFNEAMERPLDSSDDDAWIRRRVVHPDVPVREPLDQAAIDMDLLIAGESYVRKPEVCELCPDRAKGHPGRCVGEADWPIEPGSYLDRITPRRDDS